MNYVWREGIGNLIEKGLLVIKDFIEAGRAGKLVLEALNAVKFACRTLMEVMDSVKGASAELKTALKDMVESVEEFLGIGEKQLIKTGTTELGEEGKVLERLGKKADAKTTEEAEDLAKKRVKEGGETNPKRIEAEEKAFAEAYAITVIDQRVNVPITVLMAELDNVAELNSAAKVYFYSKGNDPYEIWMHGSDSLVNPLYTIKSHKGLEFGYGNRKLKPGEVPKELTGFEKKVSDHIGKSGDRILGSGDEGVRETLGIPPGKETINDFLSVSEQGTFNIGEVKGAGIGSQVDIEKAVKQMENGYKFLKKKAPTAKVGTFTIYAPEGALFEDGFFSKGGDLLLKNGKLYRTESGHVVHCVFVK